MERLLDLKTTVTLPYGEVLVSTVILNYPPVVAEILSEKLRETMVFIPGVFIELYCEIYDSDDEAFKGHAEIVNRLRDGSLDVSEEYRTVASRKQN